MGYEVILVPDCLTLRENTVKRLEAFAEKGGKVFFLGRMPEYMGVRPMDNSRLERTGTLLPAARETICRALEPWRMVSVRDGRGKRSGNLLYQMRQDGDNRWLFLAHCEKPENPDDTAPEDWTVQVAGKWNVVCYDAMEGEIVPVAAHIREGEGVTEWQVRSYAQDSHLYCLKAGEAQAADCTKAGKVQAPDRPKSCFSQRKQLPVPETVSITLEEPNVLVLDMARFMLDGGQWREREEILRLDNVIRAELGYPRRKMPMPSPGFTEKMLMNIRQESIWKPCICWGISGSASVEAGQCSRSLRGKSVSAISATRDCLSTEGTWCMASPWNCLSGESWRYRSRSFGIP